jgi:hypothetical protein
MGACHRGGCSPSGFGPMCTTHRELVRKPIGHMHALATLPASTPALFGPYLRIQSSVARRTLFPLRAVTMRHFPKGCRSDQPNARRRLMLTAPKKRTLRASAFRCLHRGHQPPPRQRRQRNWHEQCHWSHAILALQMAAASDRSCGVEAPKRHCTAATGNLLIPFCGADDRPLCQHLSVFLSKLSANRRSSARCSDGSSAQG